FTAKPLLKPEEIAMLGPHCQANIAALLSGATPSYYVPNCGDSKVSGVVLSLFDSSGGQPEHLIQFAMRPGVPMQSTLFALCEAAARTLRGRNVSVADVTAGKFAVEVTLLMDPTMNGTVAEPDLRGVESRDRALFVVDNNRSCWVFEPSKSPDQLLAAATAGAQVMNTESAAVFSCFTQSTRSAITIENVPRPVVGNDARPAAVAGTFYPGDAAELNRMLDDLLGSDQPAKESWPAVMTPHAGLIYSGRLAADVLKRVEIPETVIVIGPKHTRLGVEWAVAPHRVWKFPTGELAADPDLAARLVAKIPGLTLDAAAHQQEHAIEVELPILHRLAPHAKVVGIAIGGGNWDRCQQFARGLAEVIRELPRPPLLVISSDMNHFARDDENRRLDEIALAAFETLDPRTLLDTVTKNAISMCGVLPATIVLETLRELGQLGRSQRVGYATSADVTGDKSRVVGYAGMLVG
ncbi:MAG: AmmeMemoRadiSam system protein B, partial [Planctomycetales bacterium]|nr:AmmeMemoRadiSam system protein B [Planctomycetales bacterium]